MVLTVPCCGGVLIATVVAFPEILVVSVFDTLFAVTVKLVLFDTGGGGVTTIEMIEVGETPPGPLA